MKPHARTASAGSTDGSGRKARGLFGLACACILGLAAFLGSGASSAGAVEAFPGQGFLPDNRAWELVSPPDKNGGDVAPKSTRTRASADCAIECAVTFVSLSAFADAQGTGVSTEYMAIRDAKPGSNGWSTHGITPKQDPLTFPALTTFSEGKYNADFSPDLSTGVFRAFSPLTEDPNVEKVLNLYVRDDLRTTGSGNYTLLTGCPACVTPLPAWKGSVSEPPKYAGASSDFSRVVFESTQNLTGDGSGVFKLYATDNGVVRLVGLVPAGSAASCGGSDPACVLPPTNSGGSIAGLGAVSSRYLPQVISADGSRINFTAPVFGDGTLVTGGPAGNRSKVYQRDSQGTATPSDDTTVRINVSERTPPAGAQAALYQTASSDGSRVFFTSTEAMTDNAPAGLNHVYMWDGDHPNDEQQRLSVKATAGQFRLVFNAAETADLQFDASAAQVQNALNGLATIGGAGGSVTVTGGPGNELGSAPYVITFGGALAGLDQPLIVTSAGTQPLLGGAATATVAPWVKGGGHLSLIDVDQEPGDVTGSGLGVVGASQDGHYVYFVASGQLVAGQPIIPGQRGLYLWHDGSVSYIGSFSASANDSSDNLLVGNGSGFVWVSGQLGARVAPDGLHLLFRAMGGSGFPTEAFPNGYDHNTAVCGQNGGEACAEYYTYDASAERLACATCNPSGKPASADAQLTVSRDDGGMAPDPHLSHALSDDGRYVFFSTGERLVTEDINSKIDAYRYDGATGSIDLLSSGESAFNSYFMEASSDGSDAFILTRERLSGWDVDNAYDLYDAREGGGLPEPPPVRPTCHGDACQPAPSSVNDPTPGSASFLGTGNSHSRVRCPKGKHMVKAKGGKRRCAKRIKRVNREHARAAGNNRRAS